MQPLNTCKAIIRRKTDGKYLVLQGSKWEERPDRSQKPDLPGGIVEAGESMEAGCAREIQEEINVTIAPNDLLLVYAHTYLSDTDRASINKLIYFVELDSSPEITLSWEHENYTWLTADEVLALDIRKPYPKIFQYLHEIGVLV